MIEASAPIRICDLGGWTDTWFGGPGRVLNIAVTSGVKVVIAERAGPDAIVVDLDTVGERYQMVAGGSRVARHHLVEAALDEHPPPAGCTWEISVSSAVPAGCGTGTSASLAVALVAGLSAARSEERSPIEVAHEAHRLEVEVLGAQSGIQDQLSAALGGINFLEIDRYPEAVVRPLPPWENLSDRLSLALLGGAHDSSELHARVIKEMGRTGNVLALDRLRNAAIAARDAVLAEDLYAFGRSMVANTQAQESLHPDLVGRDARRLIEAARSQGALGWKVNGAGGDGGSLTILSATPEERKALERNVAVLNPSYRVVPVQLSRLGVQVRSFPR